MSQAKAEARLKYWRLHCPSASGESRNITGHLSEFHTSLPPGSEGQNGSYVPGYVPVAMSIRFDSPNEAASPVTSDSAILDLIGKTCRVISTYEAL
jgi:hypothetical protein